MNTFYHPDINRKLSSIEYLQSINNPDKRLKTKELIDSVQETLQHANNMFLSNLQMPEIRIIISEIPSAQGMEGILYINSELFEHCLNLITPSVDTIINIPSEILELDLINTSKFVFTWAIAHEFFHVIRKHNLVSDKFGQTPEIFAATENDADMCAIAMMYRLTQRAYSHHLPRDIDIKQLTFFGVFWGIRAFPRSEAKAGHLSLDYRLYFCLTKLVSLRERPSDPADQNCQTLETRNCIVPMIECLKKCESAFKALKQNDLDTIDLVFSIGEIAQGNKYSPYVEQWDEIEDFVNQNMVKYYAINY